jgi:hypothetical protein
MLHAETWVARRRKYRQERAKAKSAKTVEADNEPEAAPKSPRVLRFWSCFITASRRSLQRFNTAYNDDKAYGTEHDNEEFGCLRLGPPGANPPQYLEVATCTLEQGSGALPEGAVLSEYCGCKNQGPSFMIHRLQRPQPPWTRVSQRPPTASRCSCVHNSSCLRQSQAEAGWAGTPLEPQWDLLCRCQDVDEEALEEDTATGDGPALCASNTSTCLLTEDVAHLHSTPLPLTTGLSRDAPFVISQGSKRLVWLKNMDSEALVVELRLCAVGGAAACSVRLGSPVGFKPVLQGLSSGDLTLPPSTCRAIELVFSSPGCAELAVLRGQGGAPDMETFLLRIAVDAKATEMVSPVSCHAVALADRYLASNPTATLPSYLQKFREAPLPEQQRITRFVNEGGTGKSSEQMVFGDLPAAPTASQCVGCNSKQLPAACIAARCRKCCTCVHARPCGAHNQGGKKSRGKQQRGRKRGADGEPVEPDGDSAPARQPQRGAATVADNATDTGGELAAAGGTTATTGTAVVGRAAGPTAATGQRRTQLPHGKLLITDGVMRSTPLVELRVQGCREQGLMQLASEWPFVKDLVNATTSEAQTSIKAAHARIKARQLTGQVPGVSTIERLATDLKQLLRTGDLEAATRDIAGVGAAAENVTDDSGSGSGSESDDVFEVAAILDERTRLGIKQYLVRWAGCDESEDTWESVDNLSGCQAILEEYLRSG